MRNNPAGPETMRYVDVGVPEGLRHGHHAGPDGRDANPAMPAAQGSGSNASPAFQFGGRLATDLLARVTIVVLFTMLSVNLWADFLRNSHVTGLLLLAGEALVVVLTVVRRRARLVDRSIAAAAMTTMSLVGPPMLRAADTDGLASDAVTAAILAVGLAIVVAGKITLGRSFGLVPANRGVVVRGPYTLVRHPIYTGYLITHAAFFMAYPTAWNGAVILIADAALIVRALMEEKVLSGDAEYQGYCERVNWHLVPGVF